MKGKEKLCRQMQLAFVDGRSEALHFSRELSEVIGVGMTAVLSQDGAIHIKGTPKDPETKNNKL